MSAVDFFENKNPTTYIIFYFVLTYFQFCLKILANIARKNRCTNQGKNKFKMPVGLQNQQAHSLQTITDN